MIDHGSCRLPEADDFIMELPPVPFAEFAQEAVVDGDKPAVVPNRQSKIDAIVDRVIKLDRSSGHDVHQGARRQELPFLASLAEPHLRRRLLAAFGPFAQLGERILPIDCAVADEWGRFNVARPMPVIDGLLAATANVHRMTLVTRSTADIVDLNVQVLNPFDLRAIDTSAR